MSNKNLSTQNDPVGIVQQLSELISQADIQLPNDIDALWSVATEAEVHAALYQVKAGLAYKKLKAELPHGGFEKGLKERGIKPRVAQKHIAVANLLCGSNAPTSAHLLSMKYSQLLELTRLPEEKIQALEPAEIEEFSKLPVRALSGVVKQISLEFDQQDSLEAQNAILKKQVEEAQEVAASAINDLHKERMERDPATVFGLSPLVAHVLDDIPALSETLHTSTLSVVNLIEQVSKPGVDETQALQAAQAIYHFVAASHMHLGLAIGDLLNHFGEDHFGETSNIPIYDEIQWGEANAKRKFIIADHEARFAPKVTKKGRK